MPEVSDNSCIELNYWLPRSDAEELLSFAEEQGIWRPTLVRLILQEWLEKHRSRKAAEEMLAEMAAGLDLETK